VNSSGTISPTWLREQRPEISEQLPENAALHLGMDLAPMLADALEIADEAAE
jgi:hypothetical protein